jgi:RNA polymerase sigma factor (sigma-70 family)
MQSNPQFDDSHTSLTTLLRVARSTEVDDTLAMNEIVRRFEPLAKRIAGGLSKKSPDLFDDLVNAGRYAVLKAVRKHDLSRRGFPAFAEQHVRGAINRTVLRLLRERGELVSLDVPEEVASARDDVGQADDRLAPFGGGRIAVSIAQMQPDQQEMLVLRYVYDAEMKEIACLLSVSVPAVSQRFATMHRKIRIACR